MSRREQPGRCCGRRSNPLEGSSMSRSVSLVPLTLALGLAPVILSSCAMRNPSTSLTVPTAHRLSQSRAALERRLQDLTEQAETRRYEQGMSAEVVRAETTYIRRRLQEGDFHTGDRVALIVESQDGPPAVLMAAGGTTHEAKLHDMMIQRRGEIIWEGDALAQAVANGRTIDDLGLLPGDVIQVPRTGNIAGLYVPISLIATLLTIPVTIYTLTRIF